MRFYGCFRDMYKRKEPVRFHRFFFFVCEKRSGANYKYPFLRRNGRGAQIVSVVPWLQEEGDEASVKEPAVKLVLYGYKELTFNSSKFILPP